MTSSSTTLLCFVIIFYNLYSNIFFKYIYFKKDLKYMKGLIIIYEK